jgi:hypothetical protein
VLAHLQRAEPKDLPCVQEVAEQVHSKVGGRPPGRLCLQEDQHPAGSKGGL